MADLNVFDADAFGMVTMTDSVLKLPHVPRQSMLVPGLWDEDSIDTTQFYVEEEQGALALVTSSERGGVGEHRGLNRRSARPFPVPHFELTSTVMADEVQNVRAFGTMSELEAVEQRVARKERPLLTGIEATVEYLRIGAIKGIVTDGDGSTTLFNYFTEFGVSQPTEFAFDFDNASVEAVLTMIDNVKRAIRDELGNQAFGGYHAFCGSTFISKLKAHDAFRLSHQRIDQGRILAADTVPRPGAAVERVELNGMVFEEYQGSVGGTLYIDADTAHFFPTGGEIFKLYYAPADTMEYANTPGLPFYARQYPMANGKGVNIEVQSNPLPICLRPLALQQGRSGA